MWNLLTEMLTRMALIITIAYLITRLSIFRKMIHRRISFRGLFVLILIFGIFGVIGNYTAVVVNPDAQIISNLWNPQLETNNAIADTRNLGIILGGFFAGPVVGLGAALIAGGHRLLLGGFISNSSFVASIVGGLVAGWLGLRVRKYTLIRPSHMFGLSLCILTLQIAMIPVLSQNHAAAFQLIKYTGVPIILINSIGIWICAMIFFNVIQEEERTRANQTARSLSIADQTLSLFRQGLNEVSAEKCVQIIQSLTDVEHVSITRGVRQLAHTGTELQQQKSIKDELEVREDVLRTGKSRSVYPNNTFLHAIKPVSKTFIVIPFQVKKAAIGTITFYYRGPSHMTSVELELAEGLANLFSSQLEFGEVERYNQLLQDAEMQALQAQIQPHFLFNALNTIVALCRINPMLARELLLHLSTFLRNNLTTFTDKLVSLDKELENVHAYLALEQARFPDKFELEIKRDPKTGNVSIPPFIIQPLVENAIRHGELKSLQGNGHIIIEIEMKEESALLIRVRDNGSGVTPERLQELGERVVHSENGGNGRALFNIKERLTALYSQEAIFKVESIKGEGTTVHITIPLN